MNLSDYFENTQGTGILATSSSAGRVDVAIYSRPHVTDEDTVAFIMRPRLSHENLQSNPNAAYMFIEKGPGYKGKRLYLTKLREETDPDLIDSLRRKDRKHDVKSDEKSFLVYFHIDRIRPLVGDNDK
ncbi:MAG: pyridoxamine 5'-phosphate oxidase family protein [Phycisphaerae bacterium]|nr:pyridoxamine 5'-phosphate oxidase family protein [Phycisphaerae bacterium]NIP54160.1 pyridoxamine 5'-phosphate oxidase family protein [Phycisphaerae bacterium]NIS53048.1 pyridoxamine 5'-phosphate oxidase family protein [Phycisphaerae bacterium]NIU10537.1 pyridoxamine 5'-phosphate oxidase family protein [Phycisphaerae bacterium]NIU57902.1 pyridoxamine 5'-phosphate oxidase family protein [Phycisphaerae bacterium]